jgi:drug/metabolite transporter (DMT)-like permease
VNTQTAVALVLALASTTLVSLAYLREHGAVSEMPPLTLRQPLHSLRLLLGSRAWLLGFAMESGGFVLYVIALGLAPLALVQTVTAGGVGILAIAGARFAGRRLSSREAWGAGLAVGGLALLAISLSGGSVSSAEGSLGTILLWLGVTVAVAVVVFTSGRAIFGRGVGDGIAGGLFFATGDICTKLATQGGSRALFGVPAIFCYILGTSLLQIGYQSGSALTVAGIATLLTNAIPIAAGMVLLDEPLPSGALAVVRVLAFAAVTAGAILLAKPDRGAAPATVEPPPEQRAGAHPAAT